MRFGSLFSGIGGFDLGFESAGHIPVWNCEIDKNASAVLARHWPNVPNLGDVKNVGHGTEAVDVICGGFPCQDLSVAGKRAGFAGERSGLWFEFARILDELRPQFCVIENVPGLLSSDKGRDFAILLQGLEELGYLVAWRTLDAQYFGVAQRRRRVFVVGSLGNGRAAEILFEREGVSGDPPSRRKAGEVSALNLGAGSSAGSTGYEVEMSPTLRGADGENRPAVMAFQQNQRDELRLMGGDGESTGALAAYRGMKQQNYVAFTVRGGKEGGGKGYLDGGSSPMTLGGQPQWVANTVGALQERDGKGIGTTIDDKIVSQPIRSNTRNNSDPTTDARMHIQTTTGVRRLTPTECERLQGFPEITKSFTMVVCLDHQNSSASVEIQSRKSQRHAGLAERTGLLGVVRFAGSDSSTSDQQASELALPSVHIDCGERTVVVRSQERSPLSVSFADARNLFPPLTRNEDFALLLAGANSTLGRITLLGEGALPRSGRSSMVQRGGRSAVRLSGSEIMQLVSGAEIGSTIDKGLLKSIISDPSSLQISDTVLATLFSCVLFAISGYIPSEILSRSSLRVEVSTSFGWTDGQSDSVRYRQLGNAVAVPVAEWIGRRIMEAHEC